MNFPIQELELHIEDELVEIAEDYLENHLGFRAAELDKNLWVALFDKEHEEAIETEIQLQGRKHKASSCECANFNRDGICEHLIIIMLWLRRRWKKKAEHKAATASKRQTKKHNRLTTTLLLKHVPQKDLETFVKRYARSNPTFGLQLKAKFVGKIPNMDTKLKYQQLFETATKSNQKNSSLLSKKNLAKLEMVCKEVLEQCEDNLAAKNYKDTLDIASVMIDKAAPFCKLETNSYEKLNQYLKECFSILAHIAEANVAPQLKAEIWDFLYTEWQQTEKYVSHFHKLFAVVLVKLATTNEQKELLIELINTHLLLGSKRNNKQVHLLLHQLNLLQSIGAEQDVNALLEKHLNHPEILLAAIHQAKKINQWQRVENLIQFGKQLELPNGFEEKLDLFLLEKAQAQQNTAQERNLAKALFLKSFDFKYYELFKKLSSESEQLKLLNTLKAMPFSIAQRDAIAKILESDKSALLNYIKESESLDLLKTYSQPLLAYDKETVYSLYNQMINNYLNSHLGNQAATKVVGMLEHLKELRATDLMENLLEKMKTSYQDRNSLMEELAEFKH